MSLERAVDHLKTRVAGGEGWALVHWRYQGAVPAPSEGSGPGFCFVLVQVSTIIGASMSMIGRALGQ